MEASSAASPSCMASNVTGSSRASAVPWRCCVRWATRIARSPRFMWAGRTARDPRPPCWPPCWRARAIASASTPPPTSWISRSAFRSMATPSLPNGSESSPNGDEGPLSVIRAAAAQQKAACVVLGQDFHAAGEGPECFDYRGLRWREEGLACPLPGRHQLDNAACALATLEMAAQRGVRVAERALRDGLRAVRWPGRLELVGRRPDIWLDGADNPQAAEALAEYLRTLWARRGEPAIGRLILVVGMMRDKDRRRVLTVLTAVPGASQLILTRAAHPRAAAPEELAGDAADLGGPITVKPTA